MIALKGLRLFILCVFMSQIESRKKYPKIKDVVSFSQDRFLQYLPRVIKEIRSLVDIDQFTRDKASFRRFIRGNLEGALNTKRNQDSRRVQKKGRDEYRYQEAITIQYRSKILDCMFKIIYMARHHLLVFERHSFLDKTSLEYRIGYIGKKIKLIFGRAVKISELLNIKQKKRLWRKQTSLAPMTLHHKVAKYYVDFEYYYGLLKKLHGRNSIDDKPVYPFDD